MNKNKPIPCIYYCEKTGKCKNTQCPIGFCFMAKNLYCEYARVKS